MEGKITLNGREVEFTLGQTILEVAQDNQVHIPTLCHLPKAGHAGICRMCVVEVKGSDKLLPSCETPAAEGMDIWTDTPKVVEARRDILRMLIASGDHNCLVMNLPPEKWTEFQLEVMDKPWHQTICPSHGACELQNLAVEYGIDASNSQPGIRTVSLDDQHPLIVRDYSRCILCGRCVAACNEVQVNLAIPQPFGRREEHEDEKGWFPVADYDHCVHCGECVQVCPVGALFDKKTYGKEVGWEAERVRTTCPYCGVGCQMWLHVKDNEVVRVSGVEGVEPNQGSLCVKGRYGFDFVQSPERLTKPLIKENGKFREAEWDEALDLVASKFTALRDEHGPDSLGGLTSARVTNEENYLMQKLVRAGFGTNNIDHCARL